jgi:hypothetical protein
MVAERVPLLDQMEVIGGRAFGMRIGGDGKIKLSEKVVSVVDADGTARKKAIFTNDKSAEKFISKSKGRGEKVTSYHRPKQ